MRRKAAYITTYLKYRNDKHVHSDTAPGPNLYPNHCPSIHGYVSGFTSHSGFHNIIAIECHKY